jgi:diadenosine tetraphosphate (Ap4A) HIT family hydrolase
MQRLEPQLKTHFPFLYKYRAPDITQIPAEESTEANAAIENIRRDVDEKDIIDGVNIGQLIGVVHNPETDLVNLFLPVTDM